MWVQGRPPSTRSLPRPPALHNFPFLSCSYQNVEYHTEKSTAFATNSFPSFCQRRWSPSCQGRRQSPLGLVVSRHMLLFESIVSSWKSSWAPLGQVNVPAAFLEHSKLQTPIPLTHISNLEDCSTDTRKTAPNNSGSFPTVLQGRLFMERPL